jgi:phosphatidylserine/phosphatidylglycerophosphate/cardiolipin synthase-like enzyme
MMFDALDRAATRSVLITSHHMGHRAAGSNFRAAVRRALDRGVNVVLLWGSPDDASDAALFIKDLRADAAVRAGTLIANEVPLDIHCKILVVDGRAAVLSSYEFLHFLDSRDYVRHEVGLWLASRRVVGDLIMALDRHLKTRNDGLATEVRNAVGVGKVE